MKYVVSLVVAPTLGALALSLGCGASAAPGARAQAEAAAPAAAPEVAPPVFDWSPPCRVPVREAFVHVAGQATTTVESMFVLDLAVRGGEVRVDHQEELWLSRNGEDLTAPGLQDQLAPVQAAMSFIPGYVVAADGAFARPDAFDHARLDVMDPSLASLVEQYVLHPRVTQTLPFKHQWEWRALVGAWLGWAVPAGASTMVAGGAHGGRARLEHLGEAEGGVHLRRTEWLDSGPWTVLIAEHVAYALAVRGVAEARRPAMTADIADRASLVATYDVVTDPTTLRPRTAAVDVVMRFDPGGGAEEIRESRRFELDWSQAEGCGAGADAAPR